jgi:putative ATP-binding cassette transporter
MKLNALRRQEFFRNHLTATTDEYKDLNIGALNLFALADGWGEMLFFVPVGLTLFLLPSISLLPQQVLWGYVITIIFLIGPLSNIVNLLPGIGRSYVAAVNIHSLQYSLTQKPEQYSDFHPQPGSERQYLWRELKLERLCYSYRDKEKEKGFTVGPIDLSLYPGELLFITGGNGSGKSTLGKLITGLYTGHQGSIHLDDIPIGASNIAWYSQHFSAVFADYYVFDRLMGLAADDMATQAGTYVSWLGLSEKITIEDGRFSNTELSSGQRRRLAMITALLEDRPLYVFDEWTADQDAEFREMFYRELLPSLKERGKGVIVISHDERYFSLADRVIKLEYGQVVSDQPS